MFDQITPLIITYNEAPNIARVLERLRWARRIIVIDSGSTDETLAMLRTYPQVEVIHHDFADFADQCNFGLAQIANAWVLSLDADYELSDELVDELKSLAPGDGIVGYRARFVYRVRGRTLRGTLYPPRTVLYRRDRASYRNEGHGHRIMVEGEVLGLDGVIYHDDRKDLARWFATQQRYAREEAEYLLKTPSATLTTTDRIRLMGWPTAATAAYWGALVAGRPAPPRRPSARGEDARFMPSGTARSRPGSRPEAAPPANACPAVPCRAH
jgi:glycosyltransferase involved in cell wall biosynthesis